MIEIDMIESAEKPTVKLPIEVRQTNYSVSIFVNGHCIFELRRNGEYSVWENRETYPAHNSKLNLHDLTVTDD